MAVSELRGGCALDAKARRCGAGAPVHISRLNTLSALHNKDGPLYSHYIVVAGDNGEQSQVGRLKRWRSDGIPIPEEIPVGGMWHRGRASDSEDMVAPGTFQCCMGAQAKRRQGLAGQ